uniref:L1 transposable element RRM domain-containing protein n=1 Tax=Sciurus vulgaris TaxID=55149 RepID=A0A8D2DK81_SCIVU
APPTGPDSPASRSRPPSESLSAQKQKMSQTNLDTIPIKPNDITAEEMSEREFRMYIIKTIREANEEMKERMQALNDRTNQQLKEQIREARNHFNKELDILKKKKTTEIPEMKETINQVKNSIENITNRIEHLKDRTSDIEDKIFHLENKVDQTEKMVRNHEQNLQELWDKMKRPNLRIIGIEEEKQAKGMNNLFNEIISENFPNLKNEMENQVQEAYRTPNTQNYNRPTPRHIIMKIPNIQHKDRILKAVREKNQITFRGKPIRISADFSIQTLKARRAWNNIFQALKENGCQPRILYPAKLTFKFDDEIKSFHDKQKLKEFTKRKPALQNILNKIFHEEEMKNKEVISYCLREA